MANRLFKRKARVKAGKPGEPGRVWSELRTSFKVERTPSGKPANSLALKLFNLSAESRGFLEKGHRVQLLAGYDGTPLEQAFVGDVKRIAHKREGVNWITEIEAGDGYKAISEATIFQSLGPGTKPEQIVGALKESMKEVDISEGFTAAISSIAEKTQGVTLQGKASDELDQLFTGSGLEWSIQDEVLQITEEGGATSEPVLVLGPDSGLISARWLEEGKAEVVGLMAPSLRPGRRVKVEGKEVQGVFVAQKVTHNGDTHGNPWFTVAECK